MFLFFSSLSFVLTGFFESVKIILTKDNFVLMRDFDSAYIWKSVLISV